MNYEAVVGIEVHVELSTESKAFCGCPTAYGADPNTQCCPVCLGLPGALPVVNKKAVDMAIKAALAINCEISDFTRFDRKNYFYPDLTKGFQISQYDYPIGSNGHIDIRLADGTNKRIRIRRLHLEEDTGKSMHGRADVTLLDFNRSGVPLIEIVSEPDIASAEEARAYLEELRRILRYLDVSDVKLEEGSMRCEANVSLKPVGAETLGVLHEIKNIGSFSGVEGAIDYEIKTQAETLMQGNEVQRSTMRWDEVSGKTIFMRAKETSDDYRYFPEPDLPPLEISEEWISKIKKEVPELPLAKLERYMNNHGITEQDAWEIIDDLDFAQYYDQAVATYSGQARTVANWLLVELRRKMNYEGHGLNQVIIKPAQIAKLLELIDNGTISGKIAKKVFDEMYASGDNPATIVKEKGLVQITDDDAIANFVDQVLSDNPQSVEDIKNGKDRAIGYLVGQVMKASRGKANPQMVNQMLREKIQNM